MVMMKHLQEPVPSVLEERDDLPAAVGRVVTRAMAKLPANRYQNVAELLEDLTIASGMTFYRAAPSVVTNTPTDQPKLDEPDEVTVVRVREAPPASPRRAPVTVPVEGAIPPPPAATSFNPLKVIIPSAVGLLVVFAAIYMLTKNSPASSTNANQETQTLSADPNSQPVQPSPPATGRGEEGIPAGGTVNPAVNATASPAASFEPSVDPLEELSPAPTPSVNANSNSNRKAPPLPEPTRSVLPETAPSPAPSATKPPEKPAPTPTPAGIH
jgi:hypothetical protein